VNTVKHMFYFKRTKKYRKKKIHW